MPGFDITPLKSRSRQLDDAFCDPSRDDCEVVATVGPDQYWETRFSLRSKLAVCRPAETRHVIFYYGTSITGACQ